MNTKKFIIGWLILVGAAIGVFLITKPAQAADMTATQQQIAKCSQLGRVAAMFNTNRLNGAGYEAAFDDVDRAAWDVDATEIQAYRSKLHNVLDYVYAEAQPNSRVIDAYVVQTCLTFNRVKP